MRHLLDLGDGGNGFSETSRSIFQTLGHREFVAGDGVHDVFA